MPTALAETYDLTGYVKVAVSYVNGDFEGADFDKTVELENGMIFQFSEYNYSYSYRPKAVVYKRVMTVSEQKKLKIKNAIRDITLYKLMIEGEIYDVYRLR